jgi:Ni/Co efflux regulator RcnB
MNHATLTVAGRALAAALALALASGPVLADKPDWAGGGKGKHDKHEKHGKHDDDDRGGDHRHERREARVGGYFNDHDRQVTRVYYVEQERHGHCPPGLAKKNNGCMPPGQAKKVYMVGQPLPTSVVYYPVPQQVLVQLPPPPPQHKYVRVAGDILLIAVGSSMVIDAMNDLTR